jgi:hypothetical protein
VELWAPTDGEKRSEGEKRRWALGTYEEECRRWIQKWLEKLIFTGVTNGGSHTCFLAFYRCGRGLSWREPKAVSRRAQIQLLKRRKGEEILL